MEIPTNCPDCGAPIIYIKAGVSKKTGKPYNAFYACSNRCGYTLKESGFQKAVQTSVPNKEALLLEELQDFRKHLDERLDSLGEYLAKKLQ
jgi:hypothetical protein